MIMIVMVIEARAEFSEQAQCRLLITMGDLGNNNNNNIY